MAHEAEAYLQFLGLLGIPVNILCEMDLLEGHSVEGFTWEERKILLG